MRRHCRSLILVLSTLALLTFPAPGGAAPPVAGPLPGTEASAKGAFTCEITLPGEFPLEVATPLIERDRMYMAERPGLQHKHTAMRPDLANNRLQVGGRYLFDTAEDAASYRHWVDKDYVVDGQHFWDRPYFLDHDCHDFAVVGAREFDRDLGRQLLVRTERFSVPPDNQDGVLRDLYPKIVAEAAARHYTAVWLLYNKPERLVGLVYFTDRLTPASPDLVGMSLLEAHRPLGDAFDGRGWTRTFARTQFTLTIWHPYRFRDLGQRSLWPFSPPLSKPEPTDGVCVPSWGETDPNRRAPDCLPTCGDGIAQEGETTMNCPCDVRIPNRA